MSSYSSRDELLWTEDASYTYYLHGPLARTELGGYKVQGVDYAYTLQGWLKGINSDTLSPAFDMARDGKSGTPFGRVSRDVYGFTLGYYGGDYKPIDITNATAFNSKVYTHPTSPGLIGDSLFNGNISYTTLALSKINNGATTGYSYGYDQLNRLIKMRQHTTGTTSGWSNSTILTQYAEDIAYDANGNILKYLRKGNSATPDMDSLSYKYNRDGDDRLINNRLNHVRDQVSAGNYTVDIDNQSANNYTYDYIGNLRKDVAEGIDTVRWTVYGKINRIVKSSGDVVIDYAYDAAGNRTSKQVNDDGTIKTTYYVRDAQGNVMGIYSKKGTDAMKWEEQHLYGSSRLGMWRWDTIVPTAPPIVLEDPIYDSVLVGNRNYELSNHLGNVLATISDKTIGNDSSGVVNYYIAEVLSQNDYYPGGMLQPGRKYDAGTGYRYEFNGKENDNEVKGEGNQQDYGMRIYDPRLGKFLSVDPLSSKYPFYTPYQFAGNSPVLSLDVDGLEGDKNKNKSETSITIKVPTNQNTAQQIGSSSTSVEGMIVGSIYTPNWIKQRIDRDIASGSLQPKLSLTDAELTAFTATVMAESGNGMSFMQKLYIATVYYNRIVEQGVEIGLTNSYAYKTRVKKDGKTYLGKPNGWVMSMMVGMGDQTYADEPIPTEQAKWMTVDGKTASSVAEYNTTPDAQTRINEANFLKSALQKTLFSNYYNNPVTIGFTNQGYYGDLNKENDKWTNWADARAYYHLQEQGKVSSVFVVQLTSGAGTTFIFDNKAVSDYFKNNPGMRLADNPKLKKEDF